MLKGFIVYKHTQTAGEAGCLTIQELNVGIYFTSE